MSILVAVNAENGIWFGSDSLQTNEGETWDDIGPKFRKHGGIMFGAVGYEIYLQLLSEVCDHYWPHKGHEFDLPFSRVVSISLDFWESIKKLKDLCPEMTEELTWPVFFISDGKKLFQSSLGGGVQEIEKGKAVTSGVGSDVATGAIFAAKDLGLGMQLGDVIARLAVSAALNTVVGCGGINYVALAEVFTPAK